MGAVAREHWHDHHRVVDRDLYGIDDRGCRTAIDKRPLNFPEHPISARLFAMGRRLSVSNREAGADCEHGEPIGPLRPVRQSEHPCPSTGLATGPCPGYRKDHVIPLACGGPDAVSNMQWQTIAEARAKDRWERKTCGH